MTVSFTLNKDVVMGLCASLPLLLSKLGDDEECVSHLETLLNVLSQSCGLVEEGHVLPADDSVMPTSLTTGIFPQHGNSVSGFTAGRSAQGYSHSSFTAGNFIILDEELASPGTTPSRTKWQRSVARPDVDHSETPSRKRLRHNEENGALTPHGVTMSDNEVDDDVTVVVHSSSPVISPPGSPSKPQLQTGQCIDDTSNTSSSQCLSPPSTESAGNNWINGQRKSLRLQFQTRQDPDHDFEEPGDDAEFIERGREKCNKRKGNKKRYTSSRCEKTGPSKMRLQRGKPTEGRLNWTNATTLPPPKAAALQLLTKLSTVSSESTTIDAVDDLLSNLGLSTCPTWSWDDRSLVGIAACCRDLQKIYGLNDYKVMWSYFQLALTCDGYRKAAVAVQCSAPSIAEFAALAKTELTMFQSWYSEGIRLLYLCAAGTPYILFLLAATGMRLDVCRSKYSSMEDISGLAVSLRQPEVDAPSYGLVTRLIIPRLNMVMRAANTVTVPWMKVTLWNVGKQRWEEHPFSNLRFIQGVLDEARVNFFRLLTPIEEYTRLGEQDSIAIPHANLSVDKIAPIYTIRTDFKVPKNQSPFNTAQAPAWTAEQRIKAGGTKPVSSLQHLESVLQNYYNEIGEKRDPDGYLLIDTDICQGKTVVIRDADAEPVAIIISNMLANLPHLRDSVVAQLRNTWKGEFERDYSDHDGYSYYCWHGDWWNRYTERGYSAPDDANPYYTMREGRTTVHFQKCAPGHSREFLDDLIETDVLSTIFQDIMKFVNEQIRTLLPDIYQELTVFVDHLPLSEHSPAYPFLGFVINVGVATDGHRDSFDKIICVVIPFGAWEGGELCFYEAGHVWRLKPWDIVIFPSGRITHFNLHFTGLRGSLVLHSDNRGDSWATGWDETMFEYNGWAWHVAR